MKKEITEEQQEEFHSLVQFGDKLEAIRYAQQTFGLDAEQAITMVERLEQQIDGETAVEHKQAMVKVPNIVGGVFTSVGIILLALGSFFGYRSYTFLEKAVVVPGVVKEFKERRVKNTDDREYYTVYAPVLLYRYEGKDYTYESPYASTSPEFMVGDQIQLLVDPAEPGKPEEGGFMSNWFLPMLLGSLGLVFAGVGMIVMRAFRKP